jgi:iron transport multicopper oxidase
VANNPGIFSFHCHIEWHIEAGLMATFIEAPDRLQANLTIPENHLRVCQQQGIPTAGNAAGNTVDHFDLTGASITPPPEFG